MGLYGFRGSGFALNFQGATKPRHRLLHFVKHRLPLWASRIRIRPLRTCITEDLSGCLSFRDVGREKPNEPEGSPKTLGKISPRWMKEGEGEP